MESVEELRRTLEAARRAETAALRAAAEGADRAPLGNDTGDAGEADSAYRATYDDGYAGTRYAGMRADGHAGNNARQGANTANFYRAVKIDQSLNSPGMKMKPRCGICVLGPTWMVWVWGTRWTTRPLLSL